MIKRRNRFLNISIATFVAVMLSVVGTGVHSASALTYQNEIRTSFTFNSSVSLSLSSPDLIISELANGTYGISNTITLTAASNNSTGYVVTATAGDGTTYTTTDLVNAVDNSAKLGSLDTDASLDIESDAFAPGKWGYTFSNDNGSNWAGYSGLPLIGADGAELANASQAGVTTTLFKIGAKATNTQQAGEYKNKVNFTVTANPMPVTYMQDLNLVSIASLLPDVGDTTILHDKRDGQAYTVAKLADGNYWMLDNLALDLYDSNVLNNLSSANTNIDSANESTILTSLKSGNRSAGDQYATAGLTTWTSSRSYSVPMANLANKDEIPSDDTSQAGQYKIGGYYNYCAATAGSYCYDYDTSSGDATSSICPKGWRMPTGKTSGEFSALANAIYGSTSSTTDPTAYANYRAALHLPLSGYFNYGSPNSQGTYGHWWSSTRISNGNMYRLSASTSDISPVGGSGRDDGYSLRCLMDTTLYMQDVATWGSSLSTNDQVVAVDARDNKKYYVAKLADGNIWMTQNLDHDISSSYSYTPSNTDVSSTVTGLASTYATGTTTWSDSTTAPESYDPGDLCWDGVLVENWGATIDEGAASCSSPNSEPNHYHVGNYYNWTAAIALANSSNYGKGDVDQSICPAGWRLPMGGSSNTGSKSFQYLISQSSLVSGMSGNIQNTPVYFVYGGFWVGSSLDVFGSEGSYWSSTGSSLGIASTFSFDVEDTLSSHGSGNREWGSSVRCVAR